MEIREQSEHVIVAKVENKPGVVSRISGFFTRRGYNLESFTTSTTETPEIYHLTFKVKCLPDDAQLLIHQLGRIQEVIEVYDTAGISTVTREIMFIKIKCPQEKNIEIVQVCQMLDIKILSRGESSNGVSANGTITVEIVGNAQKLDEIKKQLEVYGIVQIIRSGPITIDNN